MSVIRWSPTNSLLSMHDRWNRLFDELLGYRAGDDEVINQIWAPRVDIVEDENEYRVIADLPGLKKEDVEISLENGVLTITGERQLKRDKKGENYHVTERAYGRFTRSFNIQHTIDADKIKAQFSNGELTIHLPKVEQAKPKRIEIKAG